VCVFVILLQQKTMSACRDVAVVVSNDGAAAEAGREDAPGDEVRTRLEELDRQKPITLCQLGSNVEYWEAQLESIRKEDTKSSEHLRKVKRRTKRKVKQKVKEAREVLERAMKLKDIEHATTRIAFAVEAVDDATAEMVTAVERVSDACLSAYHALKSAKQCFTDK
jgi:septation ring formation regulator EzrA